MPDVTRIIEQTATESIYNDDWALIDRPTEGEDGGTRKILVSRLKELLCGDYIADEWVAGETYTNGAIVSHEGKLYYNNSGGTLVNTTFSSSAWLEVKIDELLEKVIGSVGGKWRRVDTYHYDDLVVYGGRLYRCVKNASTQGTWVSNEWIEANAEYYFKKVREYIARYGFIPSREAISSPYNKGDLILYRAPGDTTNSLYMRLNDTENGDPTWIPENWLKVENIGGALSKIYDDMEESSCDVQIKEQSIVENNVADLTSLATVGSASGAIATFDDGSDLPMPSLKVAIEPQQDLHGYDSPWVGGAGKNKLNPNINDWGTAVYRYIKIPNFNNEEYVMSFTDKDTSVDITGISIGFMYNFPNKNTQYRWVINSTGMQDNKSNISQIDNTTKCDTIIIYPNTTEAFNKLFSRYNIQVEQGSTATSFEPYSNICPIEGWDEANVTRCGKNLCKSTIQGYVSGSDNLIVIDNDTESAIFYAHEGKTYTISSSATMNKSRVALVKTDNGVNYTPILQREILADNTNTWTATWTGWTVWYKCSSRQTAFDNSTQVEIGLTPTSYEPYNGATYTIDLDETRYGGTLDVVSGVLTITDGYIASYNGETLPSTWISDRDVYAEGTTPTVGAEVVYKLSMSQTIQLTPTQVKSLRGVNNIMVDTGAIIDAEHIRDMTTIINSLIARIEALENQ